jgi:Rrf2 family protein
MRISTKGRYGLKAVIELARHHGDEPTSVRELAGRVGVSATYLEQLIKKLRVAGIVDSSRGAQGGYTLSRPPDAISVGIVLRTLEGSIAPMVCAEEGFCCENAHNCVEAFLYRRIRESIDDVIDKLSLQDLLDEGSTLERHAQYACKK